MSSHKIRRVTCPIDSHTPRRANGKHCDRQATPRSRSDEALSGWQHPWGGIIPSLPFPSHH